VASIYPNLFNSYELPDDLFDKPKGDVKPVKEKKKKTAVNVKKRSFNEVEVRLLSLVYFASKAAEFSISNGRFPWRCRMLSCTRNRRPMARLSGRLLQI